MCISPIAIKDTTGVSAYSYLTVPCGKCFQCRKRRSDGWAFRLLQQDRVSHESHFVTLTYDDDNLPWADTAPTLVKHDLQCFFKRLRKRCQRRIKYYACGEYGTDTARPHYHALIFNASFDAIESAWTAGNIHFGDLSMASIRYVTNYMCKSDLGKRDGLEPEFSLMSKGLGKNYITSEMQKYAPSAKCSKLFSSDHERDQDYNDILYNAVYNQKCRNYTQD